MQISMMATLSLYRRRQRTQDIDMYRFEISALRFDEVTDYKTNKSNNDTQFLLN